jgi:xanthine/uracil permease
VNRLLLIAVFLEVGVVLLVVPWSRFWDRNYFAESLPLVQAVISNGFVRGAISGLGLLNLLAGLMELMSLLMARRSDAPSSVVRHSEQEE